MIKQLIRLEQIGRVAGICFALALAVSISPERALALAADPQSSIRSFYDRLLGAMKEALRKAVARRKQDIRCRVHVHHRSVGRDILFRWPAAAGDRGICALHRGHLRRSIR